MDTDDLTDMAYDSIRFAAAFCDELKAELGAMSSLFKGEEEYLKVMLAHVAEIREEPREYLEYWNIEEKTDIGAFRRAVVFLEDHIENTIRTPCAKRNRMPERDLCSTAAARRKKRP